VIAKILGSVVGRKSAPAMRSQVRPTQNVVRNSIPQQLPAEKYPNSVPLLSVIGIKSAPAMRSQVRPTQNVVRNSIPSLLPC